MTFQAGAPARAERPGPAAPSLPGPRRPGWVGAAGTGVAVLLAGAPVSAVVQGGSWFGHAAAAVAVAVGVGLVLAGAGGAVVAAGQLVALLVLLTAVFAEQGVLGVPGPGALRELAALATAAGDQVGSAVAPVVPTPEILFLVTAAFGLLAVAAHLAAVTAGAPAAAGVPLLTAFAVPTALTDELLPWWALAAPAAGFAVLLVTGPGSRQRLPGAAALTAAAVALALLVGAGTGVVGTTGRFDGGVGAGAGVGGAIGLTPFTALRGQLQQDTPAELFRVRGLPRPAYLRALTLREYLPDAGWQAGSPQPGLPLTGPLPAPVAPGEQASVAVENVGFRDYWLPLYGAPLYVSGVAGDAWAYDGASGTAYASRPRREAYWQQGALLPAPSAEQLRAAESREPGPDGYLEAAGIDPRVAALAASVTAASDTDFDRAVALVDYFTAAGSPFRYSLRTAPGNGDDALVEFLTVGRAGYCEQFASAMAVMLRTVGVPARVAVGFTAGTDAGDHRSVGTADAHAWVDAWFPGIGWTIFDPTPLTDGRTIVPPYVEQARAQAAGADPAVGERTDAGELPEPATAPAPSATDALATGAPAPGAGGGGPALWPLAAVAVLALLGAAPAGGRVLDRRRRLAAVAAGGPGAAGAGWAELLAESVDRGVPGGPSDTVRGAARRLVREHRLDSDAQQALRRVVSAVEASWYGGGRVTPGELDDDVRHVRAGIVAASSLTLRERLLPRSVVARLPGRMTLDSPENADQGVDVVRPRDRRATSAP